MANVLATIGNKISSKPHTYMKNAAIMLPTVIEAATVLAPVAAVGAAGYGLYRLIKWANE